jgi:hypothetical protein
MRLPASLSPRQGCEPLPVARRLVIVALVLLAVLGISQLVIPPIAEHGAEDRLTVAGGTADVSMSAFPAARLLFGNGSRISVTGRDLDLTSESTTGDVFSNLDGFDRVAVNLDHFRAGPFQLARFDLTRAAPEAPYHLVTRGRTTPADLASYGAEQAGLPGGPLLGYLGDRFLANDGIPIDLDMELTSDDGRIVVTAGTGTVAGIPTGPLAELVTSFVALKL